MKNKNLVKSKIAFIIIVILIGLNTQAQSLNSKLEITNIPFKKGTMYISWYNKSEGFKENNTAVYYKIIKIDASTSAIINFENILLGVYAVAIFFDENGNGIIDKNLLGIPVEKYGFSNNVYPMTRGATFHEAKFNLKAQNQVVSIRMR